MVKAMKQGVHTEPFDLWGSIIKDMTYPINSYLREESGFSVNRLFGVGWIKQAVTFLYCSQKKKGMNSLEKHVFLISRKAVAQTPSIKY